MKCICCGDQDFSETIKVKSFEVLICDSCQHGIVHPIPNNLELEALYNSPEYFDENMNYNYREIDEKTINDNINTYGNLFDKYLHNHLQTKKSILEVGQGGGFGLKYFRDLGHQVKGIDPSISSREFSISKLGISENNLIQKDYADCEINEKFDIIILNHVLEHFVNPDEIAEKLKNNLNENGVILIRVPNHDSYDRKKYGTKWPAYLPFHIHYFSEKSLISLFEKHDLKPILVDNFISEMFLENYPVFFKRGVKKLLNILGPGIKRKYNGRTISIVFNHIST